MVPVWNPGPNLTRCIQSLLTQTMPDNAYEIVLVDDGSTDGSADRLDTLAALHPRQVRVLHTPASGWPGRPRNIGIDAARGTYIHFVDNDDVLPTDALQAMCDAADRTAADVVIGRPASDFRGINQAMYKRDRLGVTLAEFPELVESTTPHKMFRRDLLEQHHIRFPEGTPHEDQPFVMRAYIHAAAITVLTDRCYYFYLRRLGSGRNAGDQNIDAEAHFTSLESVLDILDDDVHDTALRDRLARRFYRVEVLNLMWAGGMLNADPEAQHRLFDGAQHIATTRFGPGVRSGAGAVHRTLGALLEGGSATETVDFARQCRRIGLRPEASDIRWIMGHLTMTIDATLTLAGEPLRCERESQGWVLPAAMAPATAAHDRLLDPERDRPDAEVMLVSRIDSVTFGLGPGLHVAVDDSGAVRVTGTVRLDPETALAGTRLSDGVWDLRLRLWFAGISRTPALRVQDPQVVPAPLIGADARMVRPFVDEGDGPLALDAGGWLRSAASALAPSCDLTVTGRDRLRLSVSAQSISPTPVRLQFTAPDGGGVRSFGSVGTLTEASDGMAEATSRLPASLPDGTWQPWLHVALPSADPPVALPWLVCRSKRGLRVQPQTSTGAEPSA